MAIGTLESFGNVPLVREIGMIRNFVDSHPFDGLAGIVRFGQLKNVRFVDRDHTVTVHADIQRRNRGMSGSLHIGMTVHTWNMIVARMDFMAKRNRLFRRISLSAPSVPPQEIAEHQKNQHIKNAQDAPTHWPTSQMGLEHSEYQFTDRDFSQGKMKVELLQTPIGIAF
jgi:hypothetical protein